MNFRLKPGEDLTWTSKSEVYAVMVQRTDAGQTWTVSRFKYGQIEVDADGTRQIWTHSAEDCAMDQARFMAEAIRGIEALQVNA